MPDFRKNIKVIAGVRCSPGSRRGLVRVSVIKKEAFDRVGGVDVTLPHPYLEMDFAGGSERQGMQSCRHPAWKRSWKKNRITAVSVEKQDPMCCRLRKQRKNLQKTWKKADHLMIRAIIRTLRKAEKRLRYDPKTVIEWEENGKAMIKIFICPKCGWMREVSRRKEVECFKCGEKQMVPVKLTYESMRI